MKPTFTRRFRGHTSSSKDGSFFKRESHRQSFFAGESFHDIFFHPITDAQPSIQRKCEECEQEDKKVQRQPEKKEEEKKLMRVEEKKEEEKIQRATDKKEEEDKKLQRQPEKKEEEKLNKKESSTQSAASTNVATNYISSLNGKGQSLPKMQQYFFGNRMGHDFSNVKVHTDKEAAESAKSVNAKAYTIGNNIVFNEGQYDPGSGEGNKLLAHELAHVVQQENETSEGLDNIVQRKIGYSRPVYKQKDPIPVLLRGRGGKLGETYITINNSKKLENRSDVVQAIVDAFNTNLSLRYDSATKTCKVNTEDIKIDISAEITFPTDPVNDKWSGQYPGNIVTGDYTCFSMPGVNIEMVSSPSGGAALQKSVRIDEAQHFTDIIDVSEKNIEPFYTYLENMSLASATGADCAALYSAEVGNKDIDMANAFADDWVVARDKHDNPATGAHHYKSVTTGSCQNLVTITVSF